MYAISNNNKTEMVKLLEFSGNIPGDDLKTVNARHRAKLAIDMLNKAKFIDADSVKKANADISAVSGRNGGDRMKTIVTLSEGKE